MMMTMKKKPQPPFERHRDHQMEIRPSKNAIHMASYYCKDCHVWVAWLSKRDTETARELNLIQES